MSNRYRRPFPEDLELKESVAESLKTPRKLILTKEQSTKPVEILVCLRCGKRLRSKESQKLGYGPVCFKRHLEEQAKFKKRRLF